MLEQGIHLRRILKGPSHLVGPIFGRVATFHLARLRMKARCAAEYCTSKWKKASQDVISCDDAAIFMGLHSQDMGMIKRLGRPGIQDP